MRALPTSTDIIIKTLQCSDKNTCRYLQNVNETSVEVLNFFPQSLKPFQVACSHFIVMNMGKNLEKWISFHFHENTYARMHHTNLPHKFCHCLTKEPRTLLLQKAYDVCGTHTSWGDQLTKAEIIFAIVTTVGLCMSMQQSISVKYD